MFEIHSTALTVHIAPLIESVGGHVGGCGPLHTLTGATHLCKPGTCGIIAGFYKNILGLNVVLGRGKVSILFDSGHLAPQSLVYKEDPRARAINAYDVQERSAYHIAIYIPDVEFQAAFKRAEAASLIYVNHRFEGGPPEFSSAATWEEACVAAQFRIKDLRYALVIQTVVSHSFIPPHTHTHPRSCSDPETNCLGLVLEHEIRNTKHKCFPFLAKDKIQSSM
jgi:hypothetical protein